MKLRAALLLGACLVSVSACRRERATAGSSAEPAGAPDEHAGLDERWNVPVDEAVTREIALLEQRLAAAPDDSDAHHRLGLALRRAHRRPDALAHLAQAVELSPHDERYRLDLGLAYSALARLDEAEAIYRSLLDSPRQRPVALHNLGNVALRRERLDEAIGFYRQAVEAKPDYLLALYHLGLALQESGRAEEAYAAFETVMRLPTSRERTAEASRFDALHRMGSLDLAAGRTERAADLLGRLLGYYPDHPNANFTYGRALMLLGREADARAAFARHERVRPRAEGRIGFIGSADELLDPGRTVVHFRDATDGSGIDCINVCGASPPSAKGWLTEAMGAGAAWLDYDRDGRLDLYLVNGSAHDRATGEPNRLYRGDGRGHFVDVTDAAGVGHRGWGYGVAVGDVDNDGDPDIYVTNYGPDVLYRNDGDGTFTDVTDTAGVGGDSRWGTSAAFFDMEGDGDLDLYVANYMECGPGKVPRRGASASCAWKGIDVACGPKGLVPFQDVLYRNEGDGTFSDVTREAGAELAEPRYALGVVTADLDNDGDQDVYVANDSVQNTLWRNDGQGGFRDDGVVTMTAYNADGDAQAGMGTDAGDFDGDGWLDLVATNFSHDLNTVYRNVEGRYFLDESGAIGLAVTYLDLSWGVGFHDFDNDGALDLLIANGHVFPEVDDYDVGTRFRQANRLLLNTGTGRFVDVSAQAGPGFAVRRSFRGAAFADYDGDGDVDALLTALDEPVLLLENAGPPRGHWLRIALVGTRSNRDGVGARVLVLAGGREQIRERQGGGSYLSANDTRLHFGLGAAGHAERVEVRWPSGSRDVLRDVAADRTLTIVEGSAPATEGR
jgi:tetratricopeptide (TPR) repeat protein